MRCPAGASEARRLSPARPTRGQPRPTPRLVGDLADRAAPGWRAPQQLERALGVAAGATTQQNPVPMLNTSHISASRHARRAAGSGRRSAAAASGASISVADAGVEPQQVEQAVAGDVREAVHLALRAQQVERRAHVDRGRLEQLVGERCARARRASRRATGRPASSSARRASVKPFECSPLEGTPITASPGAIALPGEDPVARARRRTRRRPGRSRAATGGPASISGTWASSPPGISIPACSAPARRPSPIAASIARVGLLDGDVVDHRDRLGADADQVVDVHRDAVDADRVEALRLLGDDQLGADAVGADRDRGAVVQRQHACVVAGAERSSAAAGRGRSAPARRPARRCRSRAAPRVHARRARRRRSRARSSGAGAAATARPRPARRGSAA